MTKQQLENLATDIVNSIIDDLLARTGLADEWEEIDWDMQEEIKEGWIGIVVGKIGESTE